jgi:hypothetical protein
MAVDFSFALSDESQRFCSRIVEALVKFCGKTELEAIALVRAYWEDQSDIESDPLLYHEPPYYYAMCIAHHPRIGDGRVVWWKEPGLWPPPQDWAFR